MENINFRGVPTSLFFNGPKLGIVTDPQSVSNVIGVATFTGIATATFPDTNFSLDGGSVAFKWYFDGSEISDDEGTQNYTSNAAIVGFSSATGTGSTITINGLTVDDDGKEVYFETTYIGSAYETTSPRTAGTARSTSNAFNGPFQSGIATITVFPIIDITTQPTNQLVSIEDIATYTIAAQKTPGGGSVEYQWQLNGDDLSDGTTTRDVIGGSTAKITVTGDGSTTEIDFGQVSSYDTFTSGITYTLVADADVTTKLFATGAGGGRSNVRAVSGGRGGSAEGTFTFVKDQEYKLRIGGAGANAGNGGFSGGGNGGRGHGQGGGGGGFTGLFEGSITVDNAVIVAGGGGGGSNDPATGGAGGGLTGNDGSNGGRAGKGGTQSAGGAGSGNGGNSGGALQGGSGAAGGGGGYYGGGGGQEVGGCCADGAGGGGSSYIGGVTDGSTTTGTGGAANGGDGSFRIEFTAATKEVSTTVTGSDTDTLTITAEAAANGTIRCKVTATDVQESPVFSNTVSYVVVEKRSLLEIETYNYTDATATLSEFDLADGDLTIDYETYTGNAVCLYAGDQDIDVEMEMFGGSGANNGSNSGGEGGYSKIRFTMTRDEEYILTGLFSAINAPFLYRKASLIAVVGEGGDAGEGGNGGDGGGINVAGEDNTGGSNNGAGGNLIEAGNLTSNGIFGSLTTLTSVTPDTNATGVDGGRTLPCPRGNYWRDQGKSPCEDLGTIKFRIPDGTEISNTAEISRGYKSGYNIIQTKGSQNTGGGQGGSGATGGQGGTSNGGGGGGSGYTDGSVTVVETQLGGSTSAAKIIIRISDPSVVNPVTTLQDVTFSVGREAAFSNVITFVKESGTGPDRITFGPNAGTVSVSLGAGAVYTRESVTINGAPGGNVRLSDGQLQLEDSNDNDFNDLTVTPNNGKFTSDSRYEFTKASETVTFTQSRSSNENIQVVMTLVTGTGTGPQTITFGSATGFSGTLPSTVTATIQQGAVYTITSTNNVDTRSLSDDTLTVSDTDSNPGSLSITPDKGEWTSTSRYEFT